MRNIKAIVAFIILSECLLITVFPPAIAIGNPVVRFIALCIAIISFSYLALQAAVRSKGARKRKKGIAPEAGGKSEANLASRLMRKLTFNGLLTPYLFTFGIAVIALDLLYNAFYNNWSIGYTDTTAFLFGGMLIAYGFIPEKYAWERDFVMLFSMVLVIILIIPLMLARAISADPDANVNMYSRVMLGPPLIFVLNLIGIESREAGISDKGYPLIQYKGMEGNYMPPVGISAACAGLYSFSIFVGLFTAFVLVQYSRLDLKIGLLLLIGFLTSYVANILRMTIIVMAGYYYNTDVAVELTHEYTGLLIFLFWLGVFWFFLMKYMKSEKDNPDTREEDKDSEDGEIDDATGAEAIRGGAEDEPEECPGDEFDRQDSAKSRERIDETGGRNEDFKRKNSGKMVAKGMKREMKNGLASNGMEKE
jgi:archaeosortase C (PEF-CTERM variant)